MKNRLTSRFIAVLTLLLFLGLAQVGNAENFTIKDESVRKILDGRVGTQITLHLDDGAELTGKVRKVTEELVQLGNLSGRDFYDAVIKIEKISAIIVRVEGNS
jgi:molybdopterin-binding protein